MGMIELSTTAQQTLAPGQALTFDSTVAKACCGESHRANSAIVRLMAPCTDYKVEAHANVTGSSTGQARLSVALDGEPLPEGAMESDVTTPGLYNSVSAGTLVHNGCKCCSQVAVINTGTTTVLVEAGANLIVYPVR